MGVVNNYYLGNILKTVFSERYEGSVEKKSAPETKCENLISILGLEFAGKTELSKRIKEHYGFNLVFINDLIENVLKDYQQLR